jgi:hypothetical protein
MEEQWIVDRCKLRELWLDHPEWSRQDLARKIGRSKSWVKKWLRRIRSTHLEDRQILQSQSRARKHPPPRIASEVVERILEIRDDPPRDLGRIPGPLTILYYLQKDKTLADPDFRLPHSTRTIWKILDDHHRILRPGPRQHEPEERPAPGVEWGMDFKDVSSVPADPVGKQQHVVEILNLVDHGSSVVVASEPRDNYTAETALQVVAEILQAQGCPDRIRLDRDPRWVGSWTAKDFPAPVLRFLMCLGIEPRVCPPQRPDKNPFVERYHRNFKYECQLLYQPQDLTSAAEVNQRYVHFYNFERPNQAVTCNNQPPRVKFPETPLLPPVPQIIDPDRWILELDGKNYMRRLDPSGRFHLGNQTYYVSKKLRGRSVVVWVNGSQHELEILIGGQLVKKLPIKGLKKKEMKFTEYLEMMSHEAVSVWRRTQRRRLTYR